MSAPVPSSDQPIIKKMAACADASDPVACRNRVTEELAVARAKARRTQFIIILAVVAALLIAIGVGGHLYARRASA